MSTQVEDGVDFYMITRVDNQITVPCDNSGHDWCCQQQSEWVAGMRCPACGGGEHRLIGTGCKDFLMVTPDALECDRCGEIICPARKAVASFEPINRRPG